MDLLGDIVEKDPVDSISNTGGSSNGSSNDASVQLTGFPKLINRNEMTSWKSRLQKRRALKNKEQEKQKEVIVKEEKEKLSETEEIHLDNIKYMMSLSKEEIIKERDELLDSLDPKVLEKLLLKIKKDDSKKISTDTIPIFAEIDTNKYWIGGTNENKDMEKLDDSKVMEEMMVPVEENVADDIEEEEEEDEEEVNAFNDEVMAPQEYQFIQQMDQMNNEDLLNDVHFIKPRVGTTENIPIHESLTIDDPEFDIKLKEKYFPDLPVEVEKLKWMENIKTDKPEEVENVAEIRFDFKGNMIPSSRKFETTQDGLHHHSENQHLKGYTLEELSILARSSFPAQKCISLQTLGRILYKLGKQKYYQLIPEVDVETFEKMGGTVESITNEIYKMFWKWLKHLHVIEIVESNLENKNISIKNYATDAMWLYKQGGGDQTVKTSSTPYVA